MNPSRQTLYPIQLTAYSGSLNTEPVLLNGMQVLFDQSVAVYPVVLERKSLEPNNEKANRSQANEYHSRPPRIGGRRSSAQ